MNSCDIVQRYFSYWPWSSLLLLCWPIVARNTSTRLWSLSRGDIKNTGRKNYVSIHTLHTAELFAKHKTDDLSEAHRIFMASKWWLIKTSLNHLNPHVPRMCSVLSTCLPCFKQRSARDPGLGSTIQSPKGPEGEKRHGMKLMKVMKLKVVRIFRVLSFWKLPSTLMVHWNEGKKLHDFAQELFCRI